MSTTEKTARLAELSAELGTAEPLPAGQQRLKRAREAATTRDASTTADVAHTAKAGTWMHSLDEGGISILRSSSIFGAPSITLYRGHEIEIDQAMLEADQDRWGRPSWSALLEDEDAQIAKWGFVRLRAGRAPHTLRPWTPGSALWAEQREIARRAAWAEPNPERRAEALADVQRIYGDGPVTSTVLNTAKTASERAYDEQAERIAASAAKGTPNVGPSRAGA